MKRSAGRLFLLLLCTASIAVAQDIIPRPRQITVGAGTFAVDAKTTICIASDAGALREVAQLLVGYLKAVREIDVRITDASSRDGNTISLVLARGADDLREEGYRLDVTPHGVKIEASAVHGIANGTQSLRQLFEASATLPCVSIIDAPRYSWRGLMLDESRHFFGVEQVRKLLDRMAFYKLNRFHWHLTDSPGWRVEIKKYPKLTSVGGRGNHSNKNAPVCFYTQDEIREIVEYARVRQIVIIPEIDMPGHAAAANRAYPEFSGGGSKRHPDFTFNPGKEGTYDYLSDILKETVDLFPGPWLHFGGDETHFGNMQWSSLPDVKARMQREGYSTLVEIEHYFNRRMANVIEGLGKTTIGWDEVTGSGITAEQAMVMWWRHDKQSGLDSALSKGFKVILCPRIPCYFDFVQHSSHRIGRRSRGKHSDLPGIHAFPDDLIGKYSASQRSQIMGIQACVWTEKIKDVKRLEFMILPRMAGLAEAAWTQKAEKDYKDFLERLGSHLTYYKRWGTYYFDPFNPKAVKEPR
jgi:hexosaminidase